ncbi:MAG TPA: PadR family transcriptional regulator [Ktedonobacterales bacterium]|nr:PadR family transcriptional regulator [Ktedonobacterales bacterium]
MAKTDMIPAPTASSLPASERPARSDTSRDTLRHIILGLLGAHPMSGYDIKGAFDRSLATYWNAGSSQIYTTLKLLAAAGLVSSELVAQRGRPNRRVYRLTEAGCAALDAWLREPVPERFTKDEFLTKLFFCGQAGDEVALRHLEEHLDALRAQLAYMEWVLREFGGRASRRPRLLEYQLLVRDYKQAALQADIAVTERTIERLRTRLAASGSR